jgi:uncharacterized protein YwgA
MDRTEILVGVLNRIPGYKLSMNQFKDRLIFQKIIYLLQVFGIDFGYKFRWYLYGPYSTELSKDGFRLTSTNYPVNFQKKFVFADPNVESRLDKFIEFIGSNADNKNWLELMASIHFLKMIYPTEDLGQIYYRIQQKQTLFTKTDFDNAWKLLSQNNLIDE